MPHSPYRLRFESFGLTAEVHCDDGDLALGIPDALPPGWRVTNTAPSARFAVMRDGAITIDGAEVSEEGHVFPVLSRLSSVVRHYVAQHAPAHVFIHAGVVSVDGRTIVIPGYSRSGKTTLVTELVRVGATYYSDEYAVVDREGYIHPFAKPLSVRSEDAADVRTEVPVPAAQTATDRTRAALIVLTRYRAGAAWQPTECSKGEGAFALFRHSVAARQRASEVLPAVSQLSRDAAVLSGARSNAVEMAQALIGRVRQQAPMQS